jgi:Cu/Zn superoxide dismutase
MPRRIEPRVMLAPALMLMLAGAGPATAPATAPSSAARTPVADAPPVARVAPAADALLVRSAHSGNWSSPDTWVGGQVPPPGSEVLVRAGHRVTFDVQTAAPLRYVHVAGTLAFATDRDTRLDVGLLLVRPGEEEVTPADAVNLMAHERRPGVAAPALIVGTVDHPVDPGHHALIRLCPIDGMDPDVCPAIIDAGGRMDLHGSPLAHTWTKLQKGAAAGDATVTVVDDPAGWRVGDRIIVATTQKLSLFRQGGQGGVIPTVRDQPTQTEERTVTALDGRLLTLDKPLGYDHAVEHTPDGDWRGEVADLSRNVTVESADLTGERRGHTMYHHGSVGSISYAEFHGLGKTGHLGRYPLHFHLCGDSMRGASVVGASIWDSGNRFITIHGTDFLVVRDCVGYDGIGHGFFLEDGTEQYNVLDHNLAIQAMHGHRLPEQILAFDPNDGAGFWWANCRNVFTGNDAVECDQYGYRFEAGPAGVFDSRLSVRQPDGTKAVADIRTLPFVRFEGNEAHSQRRFALNLGGFRIVAGVDAYLPGRTPGSGQKVGTDPKQTYIGDVGDAATDKGHPFVIRDFKAWTSQWVFHSAAANVEVDGLTAYDCNYGMWRSNVTGALYRNVNMQKMTVAETFYPWGGSATFNDRTGTGGFLKPVDDQPPATIITGVARSLLGELLVTGTTEDDGTVTRVTVNGHDATSLTGPTAEAATTSDAKPTGAPFARWQVRLAGTDADTTAITAGGADAAGNVERTPHTVAVATFLPPDGVATAAAAAPVTAVAELSPAASATTQPANARVTGRITFTETATGVSYVADVDGLAPNTRHAFHIHDRPDVSSPDLLSAGKQWRPATAAGAAARPSTTLGVMEADAAGHAHFTGEIAGLGVTAADRPSVLDHAVIVHANPPPRSGPRVAGGVIRREGI